MDDSEPARKFKRFRARKASVEPRPDIWGLPAAPPAMAVDPAVARGAPGAAPATTTAGALKFVKNVPAPALLLRVALLANRISPPNLNVCLAFVQLMLSP